MNTRLKRVSTGMIAFALAFTQVLMPVQSAFATQPPQNSSGDKNVKVFVCKYAGTPGVNEKLKPGQNPISVSVSATSGPAVGSFFNDGQDRSYVVAVDKGQPTPPVTACPLVINVANIVTKQVPVCGPNNDVITAESLANVTFSQTSWNNNKLTLTASRDNGYNWSDGTSQKTIEYKFVDANTACDKVVSVPAAPRSNDPCGLNNATWKSTVNTAEYTWSVDGAGNLVVTANAGYVFTGGAKSFNFGKAADSGVLCEMQLPPTPGVTDLCNEYGNNATWNVPANTAQVSWSVDSYGNLIATALGNYSFPGQKTTHNYGKPADSGVKCVYATKPTKNDPCGTKNDNYYVPAVDGVKYTIDGKVVSEGTYRANGKSVTIVAYAKHGYELVGQKSWTFNFTNETCKPDAKVKLSTFCHKNGQYFILNVKNNTESNQKYEIVVTNEDGDVIKRGVQEFYPGESEEKSWLAKDDGTYTFSVYSFNNHKRGKLLWQKSVETTCASDVFTPEIYKRDQFGNFVTGARFTIEVCQYDNKVVALRSEMTSPGHKDCKTYYNVDLGTMGSWFRDNVKYEHYEAMKVTITESYTPPACTTRGPWVFKWKQDKKPSHHEETYSRTYSDESESKKTGAWENGSNVFNLVNDCIQGQGNTGGNGNGGTSSNPVTPVAQSSVQSELPAELPQTGIGSSIATMIALLAALVTYGAVYFGQPKKRFQE